MNLETMITENERLVKSIARKLYRTNSAFSVDDLEQIGFLALCKNGHKYDITRGKVSTFITHCVRNDMLKFIKACKKKSQRPLYDNTKEISYTEDETNPSKDYVEYLSLRSKMEKDIVELKQNGKTNKAVAELLDISPNKVARILNTIKKRWKRLYE